MKLSFLLTLRGANQECKIHEVLCVDVAVVWNGRVIVHRFPLDGEPLAKVFFRLDRFAAVGQQLSKIVVTRSQCQLVRHSTWILGGQFFADRMRLAGVHFGVGEFRAVAQQERQTIVAAGQGLLVSRHSQMLFRKTAERVERQLEVNSPAGRSPTLTKCLPRLP